MVAADGADSLAASRGAPLPRHQALMQALVLSDLSTILAVLLALVLLCACACLAAAGLTMALLVCIFPNQTVGRGRHARACMPSCACGSRLSSLLAAIWADPLYGSTRPRQPRRAHGGDDADDYTRVALHEVEDPSVETLVMGRNGGVI